MLSSLLSPNNTKRCQDNNNKNGMGNDTCGLLADCPKAKKSRTIEFDDDYTSNWAYLPSVVLYEIFKLLSHKDRINASSTCRHWRNNFYHPRFCQNATIKITPSNLSDNIYKDSAVIDNVRSATLKFDSLSSSCVSDLINILQQLVVSNNLKSLLIEPSHCQIVQPYKCFDAPNDEKRSLVSQLILECCSLPLTHFSIGGSEDLCHFVPQFLRKLATTKPNAVTLLGLASVKEEPSEYIITETSPTLFKPFKNIEVLSIDYDILCDDLIEALQDKGKLSRLIIHVHGVCNDHPGTSEEAWMNFQSAHPNCEVRVSFIHAYDEVSQMHTNILRRNMPLSHLKVYFCEQINIDLLNLIPNWYFRTLRSIVWIDSQYRDSQSTTDSLIKLQETEPDPLVMAAWACRGLEEVVLLGYQYYEESLIAIARLRCNSLRVLEVASENVFSMFQGSDKAPINLKIEIGDIMRKPWAPLKKTEMHPVLYSSVAGDSDEYLLPKILADLN